jgi:hypothetical protein
MEDRYNIYFAGQLLEGYELASVRATIGRLFKADAATLDKLFSGTSQLVKRNCDKATALKYKQAMEQAGARPIIKAAPREATNPAAAPKPMTAAEKIAALAAAPAPGVRPEATAEPAPKGEPIPDGTIQLTPAGTAVLRPQERRGPVASTVSSPDLDVAARGQRLSDAKPAPPPPAPDTSHLTAGSVGELLPNLPSGLAPLDPDTSAIELAPDGTDFSDCAAAPAAAPQLDLSGLDLAPEGADVLEDKYRSKHDTTPPATDHLSLES